MEIILNLFGARQLVCNCSGKKMSRAHNISKMDVLIPNCIVSQKCIYEAGEKRKSHRTSNFPRQSGRKIEHCWHTLLRKYVGQGSRDGQTAALQRCVPFLEIWLE